MTRLTQQPICGAVGPNADGGDCLCLEPPHDPEIPHECQAPGCGRQWNDTPMRTARRTA